MPGGRHTVRREIPTFPARSPTRGRGDFLRSEGGSPLSHPCAGPIPCLPMETDAAWKRLFALPAMVEHLLRAVAPDLHDLQPSTRTRPCPAAYGWPAGPSTPMLRSGMICIYIGLPSGAVRRDRACTYASAWPSPAGRSSKPWTTAHIRSGRACPLLMSSALRTADFRPGSEINRTRPRPISASAGSSLSGLVHGATHRWRRARLPSPRSRQRLRQAYKYKAFSVPACADPWNLLPGAVPGRIPLPRARSARRRRRTGSRAVAHLPRGGEEERPLRMLQPRGARRARGLPRGHAVQPGRCPFGGSERGLRPLRRRSMGGGSATLTEMAVAAPVHVRAGRSVRRYGASSRPLPHGVRGRHSCHA